MSLETIVIIVVIVLIAFALRPVERIPSDEAATGAVQFASTGAQSSVKSSGSW